MTICNQCNNTGSISGGEYLDCVAPGCTAAADFADLDAWLGRNGWGINTRVAREIFKYSRLRHELDLIELSGNLQELVEQQKQTIDTKQARIDSLIAAKQEAEQRVAELSIAFSKTHLSAQQHAQAPDPIGQHNAEAAQQKLVEHAQAAENTDSRIAEQVADWQREIARLQDLVAYATGNAQAALSGDSNG